MKVLIRFPSGDKIERKFDVDESVEVGISILMNSLQNVFFSNAISLLPKSADTDPVSAYNKCINEYRGAFSKSQLFH